MKKVLPISYKETKKWILEKHYAHRIPSIKFSFGLFIGNTLEGIITYGIPPSMYLASSICGEQYKDDVLELNRLVINSNVPKNSASFLVANSMNLLPKKKWIIVSFADSNIGHIGYVYQATNFIYTGLSSESEGYIDEKSNEFHFRKLGHERKDMDISKIDKKYLVKMRINLNKIDVITVCSYLKGYKLKSGLTTKQIDKVMGYKDCAGHWFRIDDGKSLPSVDDWWKLKKLLNFDDKYDKLVTQYKLVYDRKEHIKDLKLTKIKLKPKHRYIIFVGTKDDKKELKKSLRLKIFEYPKGKSERYECIDITEKQKQVWDFFPTESLIAINREADASPNPPKADFG